jgi:hypothetical protein
MPGTGRSDPATGWSTEVGILRTLWIYSAGQMRDCGRVLRAACCVSVFNLCLSAFLSLLPVQHPCIAVLVLLEADWAPR